MLLTLFKEIEEPNLDMKMDLLAIIANNIHEKEKSHKIILDKYLNYFNLEEDTISYIKIQNSNIRRYSEIYFINKLNTNYKKYLYLVLEYFLQNATESNKANIENILNNIEIHQDIKSFFKKIISKIISMNLTNKDKKEVTKNLLYKGSILIPKIRDIRDSVDIIVETLSFSTRDNEYGISCKKESKDKTINIFINGFGNDNSIEEDFEKWCRNEEFFHNEGIYLFNWPSGKDFYGHIAEIKKKKNIVKFVIGSSSKNISIPGIPLQILSEWKSSRKNSIMYSYNLFKFIRYKIIKDKDIKINLYGHSLGCNLIKHTLLKLSIYNIKVNNIYLFAGATQNCYYQWGSVSHICNRIYNFYSKNDDILKYLYKVAEQEEPIGLNEINQKLCLDKIINFDVTALVKGHSDYFGKIPYLLSKTIFINRQ